MAHNGPNGSPCVKFCVLDPGPGLCSGCGRSLDEIAGWSASARRNGAEFMAELPERMKKLKPD